MRYQRTQLFIVLPRLYSEPGARLSTMTQYRTKQCTWAGVNLPWPTAVSKTDVPTLPSAINPVVDLQESGYSCRFYFKAKDLPAFWEELAPDDDLFLQLPYLEMLEECPPSDMEFAYLIFYHQQKPVGIAMCQIITFDAQKHIQTAPELPKNRLQGFIQKIKTYVAGKLHFKVLICGNMFVTGQHCISFSDVVPAAHIPKILKQGILSLFNYMDSVGNRISGILIKDIDIPELRQHTAWNKSGFSGVPFQPNMVLELAPQWHRFEDYIEAMSSKYRVRVKRARKAAATLERRLMSFDEVSANKQLINELYQKIVDNAEFNVIKIHPDYFEYLHQTFPHRFKIWGYYTKDNTLAGFCTTMLNGEELEAHFLGLDDSANRQYQLYLNMLYDMVADGIASGVKRVVFARTAMEIKSSVGATQHPCNCYVQHRCWLTNIITSRIVRWFEPKINWTPRHPFRKEDD